MRKSTKIWLITAAALMAIGCILFAVVMSTIGWDFKKLSTVGYETNTHEIVEPFGNISLMTDTADIVLALSPDEKCRVECREEEKSKHSVAVQNDTLVIKLEEAESWYDRIGFHFGLPKITVYLPKTEYNSLYIDESTGNVKVPKDFTFSGVDISLSTGNSDFCAGVLKSLKIKASTGNISVKNAAVGSLDLKTSTGNITVSGVKSEGNITALVSTGKTNLTDVSCKNVISNGTTGDIYLNNTVAEEKFSVERSTGGVWFAASDAAEIFAETDTGDVTGTLLTEKVFVAKSDTGNVNVPKTVNGGRCEIRTDTGDIKIKIN